MISCQWTNGQWPVYCTCPNRCHSDLRAKARGSGIAGIFRSTQGSGCGLLRRYSLWLTPAMPLNKKSAPKGAFRLFSLWLCRLGDRDSLARVAHLEAREAAHSDVLAEFADLRRDELPDRDSLVLDERLLEQADFLIELLHLAIDHLLGNVSRLATGNRLRDRNFLLAGEVRGSNVFLADVLGIAGRNVHRDIVQQLLEVVGARHEVALAVHFDEHTNLAAGVDVAPHRPFARHASCFLCRHRNAFLPQNHDRLLHVALGFG